MYYCINCNEEFEKAEKIIEKHELSSPPFEEFLVCPYCKSNDFFETKSLYCKCCGAKLKSYASDYCSKECEKKGILLWKKELKRRKIFSSNPLNQIVREVEEYNKNNNTCLSYGQYISLIKSKKVK